ncbi:hypothetical protein LIER_41173 [Lithospermum erythrorhizon]|uniref:C2 domain-containing protein n=1 Tax=Lithospermum erythrorhizon TaxID=34254 RepID=A0AAV3R8T4_LITER
MSSKNSNIFGLLKVKVQKGINLAIRDTVSSDPYVVASIDDLRVKTRVVKRNCNPAWNEDLNLPIKNITRPVTLTVYDKDTFTGDDKMGEAEFSFTKLVECIRMGLKDLPDGTSVDRVQPSENNCLSKESCVVWNNGKMTQDLRLKLKNVECGELEIQIEWVHVEGAKGL